MVLKIELRTTFIVSSVRHRGVLHQHHARPKGMCRFELESIDGSVKRGLSCPAKLGCTSNSYSSISRWSDKSRTTPRLLYITMFFPGGLDYVEQRELLPQNREQHQTFWKSAIDMGLSCRSATASDRFAAALGIALSSTEQPATRRTVPLGGEADD